MKRSIIIYLYLAVLMCENKSDSVSSGLSSEDSSSTYHKKVPSISLGQKITKKDVYEIFNDLRTNNPEIDPEIFRDDFNSHVVVDRQKSKLNFERDGFQNTPKLHKKTARPRLKTKHHSITHTIHSRLYKTTNSEDNFGLLMKRGNSFNPLQSHSLAAEKVLQTQNLDNLEPKTQKRKYHKHRYINPFQDVSDEINTSNAKFLLDLKKSKNSKEYEKSDIIKKLLQKHKNKLPRLNKRRNPRNHNNSESKPEKLKYSGIPTEGTDYDKVRHIQPELDIALKKAEKNMKRQQHDAENKIGLRSILRSLTSDFVPSKTEFTTEIPIVKNVNDNSKSQNDDFTLTILDMNENPGEMKAGDPPPHEPSPLLDIDSSMYQHLLRQGTQGPNKVSPGAKDFQNNKADTLKITPKSSPTAVKQPVEMGMNYNTKNEAVNQLGEKDENNQKSIDFPLLVNSNAQPQGVIAEKTKLDIAKPKNAILRQPDLKNDAKLNKIYRPSIVKTIQPKIAKKNFDIPLVMNDEEDKIASKEGKVDVNDDFSKAEIVLTDSDESAKKSEDGFIVTNDQSDHEESASVPIKHVKKKKGLRSILRYSRRLMRRRKWLLKCRRACIGSYTKVCRRLRCSPKAKRDLKYQCRKKCKATFGERKYSSEK